MSARSIQRSIPRSLLVVSLALGASCVLPGAAVVRTTAEETAIPNVENATNSFPGIVNANAVFVRCGPADSYYPTIKLEKGTKVTVVGIKMEWLKIVPPEGSFCYIAKAYVEKYGDGSHGRVTKDSVNVRAGSVFNTLKVVPLCQLTQGMDVEIIGEQDEYFKVRPPEKAYVYVNKQFVDPDPNGIAKRQDPEKPAAVAAAPQQTAKPDASAEQKPAMTETPSQPAATTAGEAQGTPVVAQAEQSQAPVGGSESASAGAPSTRPATRPAQGVAAGPTTRPMTQEEAEKAFDNAEVAFADASRKLIEQQPLAELLKTYEPLAAAEKLPSTLRDIAAQRVETLKRRIVAADELAKVAAAQEAARQKQMALESERKELEERLASSTIVAYTAVGTLQASSLQLGAGTLYRLTDPANGRTVCYVRAADAKYLSFLGKFVGIRGELTTEPNLSLKVLAPSDIAAVEPSKVNRGVTAQIIPPSLLPTADVSSESR